MERYTYHIIAIILVTICLVLFLTPRNNKIEGFDTANTLNTEALQNIASIYNSQDLSVNTLNVSGAFNMLPKGCIIMYNGSTAPAGWALCNGTNGTPDLRNRFILGSSMSAVAATATGAVKSSTSTSTSSGSRSNGQTGGTESQILTANAIPHKKYMAFGLPSPGSSGTYLDASSAAGNQMMVQTSINTMPPYYVLTFIIKL
jgi:microcystin-dependent protein